MPDTSILTTSEIFDIKHLTLKMSQNFSRDKQYFK